MYHFVPINYEGGIWRPPSESNSLILQITVGCSHNKCIFCVSYRKKSFRVRKIKNIKDDIIQLVRHGINPTKIFLADGNALVMNTQDLLEILSFLYNQFTNLERVGIYANANDILNKGNNDLKQLQEAGLSIIYMGMETGNANLLKFIKKGVSPQINEKAQLVVKNVGITLSTMIILGLAGNNAELSKFHISDTAFSLNKVNPDYLAALTLMIPKGTPLEMLVKQGDFLPQTTEGTINELYQLVDQLTRLKNCIFRTNHASNYLPIKGTLSQDREHLLKSIQRANEVKMIRKEENRGL